MATETIRIIKGAEYLARAKPNKKVDVRGLVCPYPSFETTKLATSATEDDVLEILCDDEYAALKSLPTVLRLRKFDSLVLQSSDGTWIIRGKKAH